jgi:hypothetical protein
VGGRKVHKAQGRMVVVVAVGVGREGRNPSPQDGGVGGRNIDNLRSLLLEQVSLFLVSLCTFSVHSSVISARGRSTLT